MRGLISRCCSCTVIFLVCKCTMHTNKLIVNNKQFANSLETMCNKPHVLPLCILLKQLTLKTVLLRKIPTLLSTALFSRNNSCQAAILHSRHMPLQVKHKCKWIASTKFQQIKFLHNATSQRTICIRESNETASIIHRKSIQRIWESRMFTLD